MRKFIFLTLVLNIFFTYSYGEKIMLQKGDTIHKEIELHFNDVAIEGEEYLVFEINDDFDFNNLTLLINGEETVDKTFRIYATARNVTVAMDFFLKENAKSGKYFFSAKLREASYNLRSNQNIRYNGEMEFTHIIYIFPKPAWLTYLTYGIIVFVILLVLLFFYKRSITFSRGTIHVQEPKSQNFRLKGKTKFDSKKEGCCTDTGITFVLRKGRNGNPKIISKSKDTVLYINKKIEATGKTINRYFEVKLTKGKNQIIFKYI